MKNVNFIKEPGYVYDLFFIFILHFNQDHFMARIINYNQSSEDTEFYTRIDNDYGNISDELLPFFYIKENSSQCFMSAYYHNPYRSLFPTTYNLQTVQTALLNHEEVITNLLKFYFMDIEDHELRECKRSLHAVGKMIKSSSYSDKIKTSLYAFFLEPDLVIQKLSYEMMEKSFQLSQHYEKNLRKLSDLQNQLDIDALTEKLKLYKSQTCNLDYFNEIYVTFCLLDKNLIKANLSDKEIVLFLGFDYLNYLEYVIARDDVPELHIFANALAEKNRVEILEMIYRQGEITIRDIEQQMGLTGTNAYYHLSLMIRANMLKTRNQGRTVLYSLNDRYFAVVCDMLSKYADRRRKNS